MKSRNTSLKGVERSVANMRSRPLGKPYLNKESRAVKRKQERDKNKKRNGFYKTQKSK